MHWNHPILPHWDAKVTARYPAIGGRHDPARRDIGSSFYPELGPYSSADPATVEMHMHMMRDAGIGVAVVSWLPSAKHDDNGPPIAGRLAPILEAAARHDLRVAIHMEPYEGRTVDSIRSDLRELLDAHGDAPALYRIPRPGSGDSGPELPVLYFYDQYRIKPDAWGQLLADDGPKGLRGGTVGTSVRGTKLDVVAIALIVERSHWDEYVVGSNFDGGYTYFASDSFTYGSNPRNWHTFQKRADREGKLFVPSVGPGYDDTRIRPWNSANTKHRGAGAYFNGYWAAAVAARPRIVSVTSFNEWHEGTQIEPAAPMTAEDGHRYLDYEEEGGGPESYLRRNRKWADQFLDSTS